MKTVTFKKLSWWVLLAITCIVLLSNCGPGRWVPGNAKRFQHRKEIKQKKSENKTNSNATQPRKNNS